MRILTAEAMQEVDREAIEVLGIPSLVLMENAALGVIDAIEGEFPAAESAAIFCGPGNNGGDGLAIARHLAGRGFDLVAFVVTGGREPRGDGAIQLQICRNLKLDVRSIDDGAGVENALQVAAECDLVVDALFGTGLQRPLEGLFAELVTGLNRGQQPRIAVDVASGLSGSRSTVQGPTIEADLTVAFAAPKVPHVLTPAALLCGRVVVADIGIPEGLVSTAAGDLHLLTGEDLRPLLARRSADSHKGDFGHVLLVAGSPGKSGAAVLAARAAIRAGAGLVTVACPASIMNTVEAASVESMAVALPEKAPGLDGAALETALAAAEGKTAVAVGPGLGQDGETPGVVRDLVRQLAAPVVLDADGLNAFAGRLEELQQRSKETILTPHPGELARLFGNSVADVVEDRVHAAREAAKRSGSIVVLKGHRSLIADPLGGVYVNPTGNSGLASGGSGDVLTGMIVSFLAQGREALDATRLGVFLHGVAGDIGSESSGEVGLAAGDLPRNIGLAISWIRQE